MDINKYWMEHRNDGSMRLPKPKICSRIDLLCDHVRSKNVLQIGCAGWPDTASRINSKTLLFSTLQKHASTVYGLDISSQGIQLMKENGIENVELGDIYTLSDDKRLTDVKFDVIVVSEVIEHLANPGIALQSIKDFVSKNNPEMKIIFTIPNRHNFGCNIMQAIGCKETVHPDHNYYFSYRTFRHLIDSYNYSVEEFNFVLFFPYPKAIAKKAILYLLSKFMPCITPHIYFLCSINEKT